MAWASFALGYEAGGCSDGWASFDVKQAVVNWTNGSWGMYGLALAVDTVSESDNFAYKKFDSWNKTGGGSTTPQICIYYSDSTAPFGYFDGAAGVAGQIHVWGWGADPDAKTTPLYVHAYMDNTFVGGPYANGYRPDVGAAFPGYGNYHGFDWYYTTTPGTHTICLYLIDIDTTGAFSTNHTALGCKTVSVPANRPPNLPDQLSPAPEAFLNSNRPTLSARLTDPDGQALGVGWLIFRASDGATVASEAVDIVCSGCTDTFTPPSALPDGRYGWDVWGNDGQVHGPVAVQYFTVDTTVPTSPSVAASTSHSRGFPSNNTTIDVRWSRGTDATSGLAGYSWAFNTSQATPADAIPEGGIDLAAPWQQALRATSSSLADGSWWFHVRAVDRAGNAGADLAIGPFAINQSAITLPRLPLPDFSDEPCPADPEYWDPVECTAPPDPANPPPSEGLDDYRNLLGYVGPHYSPLVGGTGLAVLAETVTTPTTGPWTAVGLVRNNTNLSVGGVSVTAILKGASGLPLGTVTTILPVLPLRPHEPGPFALSSAVPADLVASVEWLASNLTQSVQVNRDLLLRDGLRLTLRPILG